MAGKGQRLGYGERHGQNGLNGDCFVQASLEQASREAMTGVDHSFLNDPVTLLRAGIRLDVRSKQSEAAAVVAIRFAR